MKKKQIAAFLLAASLAVTSGATAFAQNSEWGWQENRQGWWYRNQDGSFPASAWQKIDGKWYYFDSQGYMTYGWQKVDETWYYLTASGSMAFGWKLLNGKWYFFNPSGAMVTGWQKIGSCQFCFDQSGAMMTGWVKRNGRWCYLRSDGVMNQDTVTEDGYTVDQDGYWIEDIPKQFVPGDPEIPEELFEGEGWYGTAYYGPDRKLYTGWMQLDDGSWMYLDQGEEVRDSWQLIQGKWYYFSGSRMCTGLIMLGSAPQSTYLLGRDGAMLTGWIKGDPSLDSRLQPDIWYHFDESGRLNMQSLPGATPDGALS